jgi:hypothetical protein
LNIFYSWRSRRKQSKICSTNWKRPSKAGCALGMYCRGSVWFFPRWETLRFRPRQKTFDAEGDILEHTLMKSFRILNEAIKSLCSSVRRFWDATIKEECQGDYPHALQALWKIAVSGNLNTCSSTSIAPSPVKRSDTHKIYSSIGGCFFRKDHF